MRLCNQPGIHTYRGGKSCVTICHLRIRRSTCTCMCSCAVVHQGNDRPVRAKRSKYSREIARVSLPQIVPARVCARRKRARFYWGSQGTKEVKEAPHQQETMRHGALIACSSSRGHPWMGSHCRKRDPERDRRTGTGIGNGNGCEGRGGFALRSHLGGILASVRRLQT